MKNCGLKNVLGTTAILLCLASAARAGDVDYHCDHHNQLYKKPATRVGLGSVKTGDNPTYVTFCASETDDNTCYAMQYNIDESNGLGKAELATLLMAESLQEQVTFWCNDAGWATNLHIASP